MTRKDYVLIAKTIHKQWALQVKLTGKGERSFIVHQVAVRLACVFENENAHFDRDRFLKACGIEYDES